MRAGIIGADIDACYAAACGPLIRVFAGGERGAAEFCCQLPVDAFPRRYPRLLQLFPGSTGFKAYAPGGSDVPQAGQTLDTLTK